MATQQQFKFKNVELYEHKLLGEGSYGKVCRAKCDELPCAVKILHSVLFQGDPTAKVGENVVIRRFEQECRLLSCIVHPCIIQYLGTYPHPITRFPVLLMELMDESLTSYLERSPEPLQLHVEVKICHNVAMAIAYLHNNGIIHRDISSNNVLLMADCWAKLTDFGMSRLADPLKVASLTQCPGSPHYMPPEAQDGSLAYSEKLDVFSFGVLCIQIMTRQFPNPEPRRKRIPDCRYAAGFIEVPIPDDERRKAHISMINPKHPLLRMAMQCIEFDDKHRPSASNLCQQIEKIRDLPQYSEVDEKKEKYKVQSDEKKMAQLEKKLGEMTSTNKALLQRVHLLESQASHEHKMQIELKEEGRAPCKLSRGSCTANGNKIYFNHNNDHQILVYDNDGNAWTSLPRCPFSDFGLVVINNLLTVVGGDMADVDMCNPKMKCSPTNELLSLVRGQRWQKHFPAMPTKRFEAAVVCTVRVLVVAGGKTELGGGRLSKVEVMDLTTTQWYNAASLPIPVNGMSISVAGQWLYMLGGFDEHGASAAVFRCELAALRRSCQSNSLPSRIKRRFSTRSSRVWYACESLPVYYATCITLHDELIAVGGVDSDHQPSDNVYIFSASAGSWQVIGHMTTARYDCLAASISHGHRVVVVGGCTSSSWESWTDIVEVGQ